MAVAVPKLPEGYVAQMASHRDIGDTCYEFCRVYDDKNHLVPDLSYWIVTPIGDAHGVDAGVRPARAVSYKELAETVGKLSWSQFASPTVPVDELRRWVAREGGARHHHR